MTDDSAEARSWIRLASFATLVLCVAGFVAIPDSNRHLLQYRSLFYEQFARFEPPALVLIAAFAVAALILSFRAPQAPEPDAEPRVLNWLSTDRRALWLTAAFAAVVVFLGFAFIFHHYFLADDENAGWVQALIFAHGKTSAVVPQPWCRWIGAMTPTTVAITPPCGWNLQFFLPVHSLIRSWFIALHVDWLAGPLTAVVTLVLVWSTARIAWPERRDRAVMSVLVVALSTQFLFMSMTMFSGPTDLLFSALWLWLYVQRRTWATLLFPWVGFLAFGVHNPLTHALWVAPFALRILRRREWRTVAYLTIVYVIAIAFWAHQLKLAGTAASASTGVVAKSITSVTVGGAAVRSHFAVPDLLDLLTTAMHVTLIATWNSPILILVLFLCALDWSGLDDLGRDLLLGVLVMIAVRAVEPVTQGEGWGYRFVYPGVINFGLLAALGIDTIASAIGRRRAYAFAAASLVASLVIQLPMRAVQVEHLVGPYARTYQWVASRNADVVVFPLQYVRWGRQMLRNDPFLRNSPKLVDAYELDKANLAALQAQFPGRVLVLTRKDVLQFGAETAPIIVGGLILTQ
ncbi:MAG TPA: hypothetical protein VN706_13955 [Gemmatimonadaceae bacterium]|nr:hypothetical protein [Gemmatimonadaceae bacterium]